MILGICKNKKWRVKVRSQLPSSSIAGKTTKLPRATQEGRKSNSSRTLCCRWVRLRCVDMSIHYINQRSPCPLTRSALPNSHAVQMESKSGRNGDAGFNAAERMMVHWHSREELCVYGLVSLQGDVVWVFVSPCVSRGNVLQRKRKR